MILSLLALLAASPVADTTSRAPGVDYRIEASLDEGTNVLHGRARLRYTNHSTSTLDTLYFHQHLNAFRPNSAWARREAQFGELRFQNLGPEEYAYERFTAVRVGDKAVKPVYPGAPDSTVVGIPLPAPLAPGQTVTVSMDWDARLSTLPRRQGRKDRHYDFAQWYPRIAVFENGRWQTQPLLPQGEFYGEFATYDITLDLAADQVIGATGVPVSGDPGWGAAAAPLLRRDAYTTTAAEPLGLLAANPAAGRKQVRWHAEQVHHFGWSIDPTYRHEGSEMAATATRPYPIAAHVLYLPADTSWSNGIALGRTVRALSWLEGLFGPYVWPQITNVHRLESGGTEFPMLIMDGSASEGLIAHELAHQYVHGMLANNEWRSGWLDEGFASFVTNWYLEDQGEKGIWDRDLQGMRAMERNGASRVIAQPGADFPDPRTYSAMTYTKTSLVLRMLRDMVGADTMREIMRRYYAENKLTHVTEADFRRAVNEVTGQNYDWFFDQWLHTTKTLDYGVGEAKTTRRRDGQWVTQVQVIRMGEAWMPVRLQVDGVTRTLTSRDTLQRVEIVTPARPTEVVLDPNNILLDLDASNNRRAVK
jgi:hypothetical protein